MGPLEVLSGSLRDPLGLLWSSSGASRGVPGELLGRLGALLGRSFVEIKCSSILGSILAPKRVPKGRHLGSPNGAKIDQQKRCKFKSEKITSWSRLGAILGRFSRRLGVKNVHFSLVFKGFRENPRF